MKEPKQYNITPAKGQALLTFQGRRFPDKIDVFETEVVEEVRTPKEHALFDKENDLNSDFRNLVIQGDCLSACAYLKSQNIKVDLVYIDPPFASGANYAKKIYLRNGGKSQVEADDTTIGEEIIYGDIWQKEDYLNWLYERLLAIKDIMSENASIYVHLDWHIGHYVKILLDEVFGEENLKREIIWNRMNASGGKAGANNWIHVHDSIFYYVLDAEKRVFNKQYEEYTEDYIKERFVHNDNDGKGPYRLQGDNRKQYLSESKGISLTSVWDIPDINVMAIERQYYTTQKPETIVERIITASSDNNMIVADFFSGSGTSAKVAHGLNRKFIACDIGINAIQTTRDRLVKAGANFDLLKIHDGLRLFRNPTQTTAKIFSIIDGFTPRTDLGLSEFWDGGIAQANGTYTPVKFSGIHDKLTKELLDVYLEEIYKLEDVTSNTGEVIIIYAHKDVDIDQNFLIKQLHKTAKTELKVKLVSLDYLLGEKRDALFTPDNANIKISKQDNKYKVEIKKFYSPYLKNKIDDYNAKKTKRGSLEQDESRAVKISDTGLELIEAIQFDTTMDKVWKSNLALEDKAGIKEKIKGEYVLPTDMFKMKIRNIAGDEIIINSKDIRN